VVTRVVTEDSVNLGEDIGRQLGSEPKSLGIAGVLSACLAFVPGFPSVVFLVLAAFLCGLAWMLMRRKKDDALAIERKTQSDADEANDENLRPPEEFEKAESGTVFTLVGSRALKDELTPLRFANAVNKSTTELALKTGFPIRNPAFVVDDSVEGLYIHVEGLRVKSLSREEYADIPRAMEIMTQVFHANNTKAFDNDIATLWLTRLKESFPRAVTEIDQSLRSIYVVDVVRDLLEDGLRISQPRPILEALVRAKDLGLSTQGTADLARSYLRPMLIENALTPSGELPVIVVDFAFENHIRQLMQRIIDAPSLAARDPLVVEAVGQLRALLGEAGKEGLKPVVICQNDVRRPLRTLLRALQLNTTVLGLTEIDPGVALKTVGMMGRAGNAAAQAAPVSGVNPPMGVMPGFQQPAFPQSAIPQSAIPGAFPQR
jgi:type III secretion protein V